MFHAKTVFIAGLALAILAGCANDPYQRTKLGAVGGAALGGIIGHQLNNKSGALIGAALGALAGGAVGNYMDNQQRDFESELAAERRRHAIDIKRMSDGTLRLNLNGGASFTTNSDRVKPTFRRSLNKLARLIKKYDQTVVYIVGHTDNKGSGNYNQKLSEDRAVAVADYFSRKGVSRRRMRTEGRGESEPRASNRTASGRQANRRVEIYLRPVVEGDEDRAYESPRYRG